jgi:hypothetical protein
VESLAILKRDYFLSFRVHKLFVACVIEVGRGCLHRVSLGRSEVQVEDDVTVLSEHDSNVVARSPALNGLAWQVDTHVLSFSKKGTNGFSTSRPTIRRIQNVDHLRIYGRSPLSAAIYIPPFAAV